MMKYTLIILLLVALALQAEAQSLLNGRAPDFELRDQHEQVHMLKSSGGRSLVLLGCDKEGAEQCRRWGSFIRDKYGDRVGIVRIADVSNVPFFLKGKVRKDFKNNEAILLDWQGSVFRSYGLKPKVANVVMIDKKGSIRLIYSGAPETGAVDRLFREIESAE